ncbi:MAG: histone deacetylase, partial [Baekduiaceae bacterium]
MPDGHKFPLAKYRRLRERLVEEGVASPDDVVASAPASWELLGTVHAASYLDRVRTGAMTDREIRVLGLPWSAALVERG